MSSAAVDHLMQAQSQAVRSQIDMAVLKKQLDATKSQGQAVTALLEAAAQLSKAPGKGLGFDAVG